MTVSKEDLLNVKKIVVHKFCHDGTSSAMIIKDVLHDVEVFFAGHKDKEYLELKAEPGLLFCDISPPEGREKEFLKARSIVLDHHIKCEKVIKEFEAAGLGAYGEMDEGVSGAVLAYRHVWMPLEEKAKTDKRMVCSLQRLAGIRDTYQKDSIEWVDAQEQTEALAFYSSNHYLDENHPCGILPQEKEIGKIISERNNEIVKRAVERAFIHHWNGIKVAIIPGHKIISDAAEELRKTGVPITFAFGFKVSDHGSPFIAISSRSDGSFDCNKFGDNYGGGGHVQAAGGIVVDVTEKTMSPYVEIARMLEEHGKECLIAPSLDDEQ